MNHQTNQATINMFAGVTVQTSGAEPLPARAYYADYLSVEAFSDDNVVDKLKWRWKVATGQHAGREATSLTDTKLTVQTQAGRLIACLLGRPLASG